MGVRAHRSAQDAYVLAIDPPFKIPAAVYPKPNGVVGVKSSKGGQAYYFNNARVAEGKVGFNDVVWYDNGRGIWINFRNSFVINCAIRRRAPINGQVQVMSTSSGGPQFLTPAAMRGKGGDGTNIDHFIAESTGDDSIAIFNDMGFNTVISNTDISSSFARTINLFKSCNVKLENNVGRFCSPQADNPKQYKGCITDTSHPGPSPCGPNL